jgi:hypothetical protein
MKLRRHKETRPRELEVEVEELRQEVSKSNDPKKSFWRGALGGLGGVVGATILVALFAALFTMLGGVPLIGDVFRWIGHRLGTAGTVYFVLQYLAVCFGAW